MIWDRAGQRAEHENRWSDWLPFQTITSIRQAKKVTRGSTAAASLLCIWNCVTALLVYFDPPRCCTIAPRDSLTIGAIHVGAALAAALLAVVAHNRRPLWAAWAILVWAFAEMIQPVTAVLYAHAAPLLLGPICFGVAFLGLRGVYALRKFEREGERASDA